LKWRTAEKKEEWRRRRVDKRRRKARVWILKENSKDDGGEEELINGEKGLCPSLLQKLKAASFVFFYHFPVTNL
jgi:hypothetical protein